MSAEIEKMPLLSKQGHRNLLRMAEDLYQQYPLIFEYVNYSISYYVY